ncbi:G-protein coupled receptor 35-like [Protopterus annectens]|uniref:G-protein coupled receptor 35-like n=1 Tax=Protopterus annectens TaxID=7888 RepID=UPI001CF9C0CA|nr:G-protein coupled receptor 35-like [Protopterus annectens]
MPCNITAWESVKIFQFIINVPCFICGLILNALAIWVFCCKMKKWTETTVYMINLAITNCNLIFSIPFKLYAYVTPWNLGESTCSLFEGLHYIYTYTSIYTAVLISLHRYFAIIYPFKSRNYRSTVKAIVMCTVIWLFITGLSIPISLTTSSSKLKNVSNMHCFQKTSTKPWPVSMLLTIEIVGFFGPLLVLSFCAIQIIRCLKQKRNVAEEEEEKKLRQIMHIIAANITVFIICFMPVHLGYVIKYIVETQENQKQAPDCSTLNTVHSVIHILTAMANINCCLDAICYYIVATDFRKASFGNKLYKDSSKMCHSTIRSKSQNISSRDIINHSNYESNMDTIN